MKKHILFLCNSNKDADKKFKDVLSTLTDIVKFSRIRKIIETEDRKITFKTINDSHNSFCGLTFNSCIIDDHVDVGIISNEKLRLIQSRIINPH